MFFSAREYGHFALESDSHTSNVDRSTKPSSLGTSDNVDFLFPDFKRVEMDYLKKTGIHPIMHVTVIKRSLLRQHPWLARSITKAFEEALEYAYEAITERGALRYILPWLEDHVLETKKCVDALFVK